MHLDTGTSVGSKIYPSFRKLVEWARLVCERFGAPPQVVCDASDELAEVDADLAAQKRSLDD